MSVLRTLGVEPQAIAQALAEASLSNPWELLPRVIRWFDGAEEPPEGVIALAIALRRSQVAGPPLHSSPEDRVHLFGNLVTDVLDEVARKALAAGWEPPEVAAIGFEWAATVSVDLRGEQATGQALSEIARRAVRPH
jgi:hypothetical protein